MLETARVCKGLVVVGGVAGTAFGVVVDQVAIALVSSVISLIGVLVLPSRKK